MRRTLLALTLSVLTPLAAFAANPLSTTDVAERVSAYATARGISPGKLKARVTGVSRSGKSTWATLTIAGGEVNVAVNHDTGRVQSNAAALNRLLLMAHTPMRRAGLGTTSRFATRMIGWTTGEGVHLDGKRNAPLGTPRAGQSVNQVALDAWPLGENGSVTLGMNTPVVAGRMGAGFRVREAGVSNKAGEIINQTPGLVIASDGKNSYRLGYAGYKSAGDVLLLANAMDPIPAGTRLTMVKVIDAPNAPHNPDPTNNAVAAARGVKGFDLIDVKSLPGRAIPKARNPIIL